MPTRILLADDHTLMRQGLRHILESHADFEVVAEASSGIEAVQSLFDEKHRNAEAIVCDYPCLNCVCLFRRRIQVVDCTDAKVTPYGLRFVRQEIGCGSRVRVIRMHVDQGGCSGIEVELPDFLFQGHTT